MPQPFCLYFVLKHLANFAWAGFELAIFFRLLPDYLGLGVCLYAQLDFVTFNSTSQSLFHAERNWVI
jgi:hypothetical protein